MSSLKCTVILGLLLVASIDVVISLDLFSTMDFARDTIIKHSNVKPSKTIKFQGRAKSGSSLPSNTNLYSNKFLRVLIEIERGIAEAQTSHKRSARNSLRNLRLLKTSIQEAVKNKMYQFARHQLGRAFFLINKKATSNSSRSGRRKRTTATGTGAMFVTDLKNALPLAKFNTFLAVEGGVTLAFAIDTTGSMTDEIAAAKQIAIDVINIRRNDPVDYILSPFGDPKTGPVTYRNSKENASFVADIKTLTAVGGGDCPELTFRGIMNALDRSPDSGSPLYVFTDAPAKDNHLVDDVIDFATNLGITVNFFLTGLGRLCNSRDSDFSKVAEATSGRVLQFANAMEMIKMSSYIGKSLPGFNIITTGSKPRRKRRTAGNKSYTFPIDESVETMLVCFASDTRNGGQGVVLKDPKGVIITSQKVTLNMASVYEIQAPKIGLWSIQIPTSAGQYTYDVKSTSESTIDFSHYFLVTIKRPRYKVEFFTSNPVIGKSSRLVITTVGADKIDRHTLKLELVTQHNEHIRDVNLTSNNTKGIRYTATFVSPSRPYKLKIKGITVFSNPFERISHHIIQPKSVILGLFFCKTENTIRKGGRSTTVFRLYNAAEVVKHLLIEVRDKLGFAQPISQASRIIRGGRMGYFSVSFVASNNVTVGTVDTASVTVSVNKGQEKLIETIQLIVVP